MLEFSTNAIIKPPFLTNDLERLDISNCSALDQFAIVRAKESQRDLQHIAISRSKQFTVLAIACLCSFLELVTIKAHGLVRIKGIRITIFLKNFRTHLETNWRQRKASIFWKPWTPLNMNYFKENFYFEVVFRRTFKSIRWYSFTVNCENSRFWRWEVPT